MAGSGPPPWAADLITYVNQIRDFSEMSTDRPQHHTEHELLVADTGQHGPSDWSVHHNTETLNPPTSSKLLFFWCSFENLVSGNTNAGGWCIIFPLVCSMHHLKSKNTQGHRQQSEATETVDGLQSEIYVYILCPFILFLTFSLQMLLKVSLFQSNLFYLHAFRHQSTSVDSKVRSYSNYARLQTGPHYCASNLHQSTFQQHEKLTFIFILNLYMFTVKVWTGALQWFLLQHSL